jgi:adenylylsulfate kinase-like enzyme
MVVWIVGLSGSGKSTLANNVVALARQKVSNVVLLDGDLVRSAFENDIGHTLEDRLINAKRICQLGKLLDDQGVHVVCPILSIFPETRGWNQQHLNNYYEVFIDSPIEDLVSRDVKGLYRKFNSGEIDNVAGMDINFPRPENANLVIENTISEAHLLSFSEQIVDEMLSR